MNVFASQKDTRPEAGCRLCGAAASSVSVLREAVVDLEGVDATSETYRLILSSRTLKGTSERFGTSAAEAWLVLRVEGDAQELARFAARIAPSIATTGIEAYVLHSSPASLVVFVKWLRPHERELGVSVPHLVLDHLGSGAMLSATFTPRHMQFRVVTDRPPLALKAFIDDLVASFEGRFRGRVTRIGPVALETARPARGSLRSLAEPAGRAPSGHAGAPDEVLAAAWRLGWFETPRKCGIRDVAREVSLSPAAALKRLRAAERGLLAEACDGHP